MPCSSVRPGWANPPSARPALPSGSSEPRLSRTAPAGCGRVVGSWERHPVRGHRPTARCIFSTILRMDEASRNRCGIADFGSLVHRAKDRPLSLGPMDCGREPVHADSVPNGAPRSRRSQRHRIRSSLLDSFIQLDGEAPTLQAQGLGSVQGVGQDARVPPGTWTEEAMQVANTMTAMMSKRVHHPPHLGSWTRPMEGPSMSSSTMCRPRLTSCG